MCIQVEYERVPDTVDPEGAGRREADLRVPGEQGDEYSSDSSREVTQLR